MCDDTDDLPLEVYWDDIRVARHRAPPVEEKPDFGKLVEPTDLVIGTSKERVLVIIKPDGRLLFGPGYRPDEAAMVFWEAMGQARLQAEDRILLFQHMEAILAQVGRQDMVVEQLRLAAAEGDTEAGQRAGHEMLRLERLVHQTIELGRGIASRPEVPVPAVPERVPQAVDEDRSDYPRSRRIERVINVLAPDGCPIFEWGHERTPSLDEVQELAERVVDTLDGRVAVAVEPPAGEMSDEQCPHCHHLIGGVTSGPCPECGQDVG